jgi:hypothetical protein
MMAPGIVFVTQTGTRDPTNKFTVKISDGIVTHRNLVKGYVAENGAVAREARNAQATGPRKRN